MERDVCYPPKVFCSLCGGGFAGIEVGIGVMKALDDLGIRATKLAGGSAGGIVVSLYASFNCDARKLEKLIKETDSSEWFEFKPWQLAKKMVGLSNYCYDTTGLYQFLQKNMTLKAYQMAEVSVCEVDEEGNPGECFMVPATPAHTLATGSIPEATPPVRWDGKLHGDGGLKNLLPTVPISEINNWDHIFYSLCPDVGESPNKKSWGLLHRAFKLVTKGVMQREIKQIKDDWTGAPHTTLLDPPPTTSGGLLTWSNKFELIDSTYEYTYKTVSEEIKCGKIKLF